MCIDANDCEEFPEEDLDDPIREPDVDIRSPDENRRLGAEKRDRLAFNFSP